MDFAGHALGRHLKFIVPGEQIFAREAVATAHITIANVALECVAVAAAAEPAHAFVVSVYGFAAEQHDLGIIHSERA